MTTSLTLNPELERKLRDRAAAAGLAAEAYAAAVLVRELSRQPIGPGVPRTSETNPEEVAARLAQLNKWAGSVKFTGTVDDSRESIDAGRGE